ncbi:RNA 2',3'-cyclic phosphodiesterase [Modicisalibacter coralii]|uniref:RNA 2',3'-cyclic phosphodiesterase n=1 Tax=Modicisalibacter coralii TaxID=2304602 RepID=UPI00193936F0|nr:RNA 2',3'-cyclic phosphodiesterase [Halomonas coralii]
MTQPYRLFFALWPDSELRDRLATLAHEARRHCGGRATPPDKLHLTLAFIGEAGAAQAESLTAATRRLCMAPGTWRLDHGGHFRGGGIVWLGGDDGAETLTALHRRLAALAEAAAGLPLPSDRPFRPHVTLRRRAKPPPAAWPGVTLDWHYRRVALVASSQRDGQHRYRTLAVSETASG